METCKANKRTVDKLFSKSFVIKFDNIDTKNMAIAIKWEASFEIGNEEIDNEHRFFLKIIQKIDSALQKNENPQHVSLLLDELYKYAQFHFTSEENVMIFSNYPYYKEHKQIHQDLLNQLGMKMGYKGNTKINTDDFINFLLKWFKEHTTKTDLKLAKYLREQNLV